jgi:hypothetical protein
MRTATFLSVFAVAACGPAQTASVPPARTIASAGALTTASASHPVSATTGTPIAAARGIDLDFEHWPDPAWSTGNGEYEVTQDLSQAHSGRASLRLEFAGAGEFCAVTAVIPAAELRGKRLRYTGWLRTVDVTGFAGLWARADAADKTVLAFENMQDRGVTDTTAWAQYVITLDIPVEAQSISFGALLAGEGTAWVDSLALESLPSPAPPPSGRQGGST